MSNYSMGITFVLSALISVFAGNAVSRESLSSDHLFRLSYLDNPQISPDGEWIAYTESKYILEDEDSSNRIWMVPSSGGRVIPMTTKTETSFSPRWSPDGKYLAFLSNRNNEGTQVWRLDLRGGEAVQLTHSPQSVQSFEWSPSSDRLLLLMQDISSEDKLAWEQGEDYIQKTQKPWVIDRIQFKEDYLGYLDRRRTHIYILDLYQNKISQLTFGDYDDFSPAWSPDGKRIAFSSNRTEEPDLNYNSDIWTVSSTPNPEGNPATLTQITSHEGADDSPNWSPDGAHIVHTSVTHAETHLYSTQHIALSDAKGGGFELLTKPLDRMLSKPRYSNDNGSIYFLLEDSGEQHLAKIILSTGDVRRLIGGRNVVYDYTINSEDELALLISQPYQPDEIFTYDDGVLNQRSFVNYDLLQTLQLGEVVEVKFKSKDGTSIEGFVVKPPGFSPNKRYPTILDIHGGPQSQYDYSFNFDAQLLAANGYLVVHPNPRGSTGYGRDFCLAIWQNWGGPDYEDVMAAVDDVISRGWGDPKRLGVMGWSYGGMMTNHVITKTERFKAAVTGASATLYAANYGHDQYQRWWEQELGLPWEPKAREIYERISPFNQVTKVKTPTLIVGGEIDWNVPIINSEQLYLALKRLGVDTQLVVYPDEYHNLSTPSYIVDLHKRTLDWFNSRL